MRYLLRKLFLSSVKNNFTRTAKLLLWLGLNPNFTDSQSATPLHKAAQAGNPSLIDLLLKKKPDTAPAIDIDDLGNSPLHYAALKNNSSCVNLLIGNGDQAKKVAKCNLANKRGRTPLHHAVMNNHEAIVSLLITQGAEHNLCDKEGKTPLYYALRNGNATIAEMLLSKEESSQVKRLQQALILHAFYDKNYSILKFKSLEPLLFKAAIALLNEPTTLSELLKLLPENALKASHEITAYLTKITMIIEPTSLDKEFLSSKTVTPLHKAASTGDLDTLKKFLATKEVPHSADDWGNRPLHYAAYKGDPQCVDLLIRKSPNKTKEVNFRNNLGLTPLHNATQINHSHIVTLLLERGADANIMDLRGKRPLYYALQNGNKEIIESLLPKKSWLQMQRLQEALLIDVLYQAQPEPESEAGELTTAKLFPIHQQLSFLSTHQQQLVLKATKSLLNNPLSAVSRTKTLAKQFFSDSTIEITSEKIASYLQQVVATLEQPSLSNAEPELPLKQAYPNYRRSRTAAAR